MVVHPRDDLRHRVDDVRPLSRLGQPPINGCSTERDEARPEAQVRVSVTARHAERSEEARVDGPRGKGRQWLSTSTRPSRSATVTVRAE